MANQKVLIIEDDVALAKLYEKELLAKRFEVLTATDGITGLEMAESANPLLIFLELDLPKMDGLALLQKIRYQRELEQTPVILLINPGQEKAIFESFKLGEVDYVVKSDVTPEQVAQKAEKIFEREQ